VNHVRISNSKPDTIVCWTHIKVAECHGEFRKRCGDVTFCIAGEKEHELIETVQGLGEGDIPIPFEIAGGMRHRGGFPRKLLQGAHVSPV
jgi:hypothetical protein